jgi:toxin-antitoxin system PIN domain toxin
LIDLNLLLYAVNTGAEVHRPAKKWLEEVLSGEEAVAIPWIVILGFLRVATNRRVWSKPLTADQAMRVVDGWVGLDQVVLLHPGKDHWPIVKRLLQRSGTAANLTTDAHLAALAIEHDCELCSTDRDFAEFTGLRWINPLASG